MNGIAQNIVPSDEQLKCKHVRRYVDPDACRNPLYATKTYSVFCPKCGARLIERDGQGREAE